MNVLTAETLELLHMHLDKYDIYQKSNIKLRELSYLGTGGYAKVVIYPASMEELLIVVRFLNEGEIEYKLVGNTSNLIFLDDRIYGVVICTLGLKGIEHNKTTITAECGASLQLLSRRALQLSSQNYEGLEGIPGTVGGAVYMNAGAYGTEVRDVLESVDVLCPDGKIMELDVDHIKLGPRMSIFREELNDHAILRARFRRVAGAQEEIYSKMELYHAKRHKYQEYMYQNLGSLFSGSIYQALAKKDRFYKIVLRANYLLFYRWKLFRRESPINRKWLNKFTVRRFGIRFEVQPFSNKTMNCLINNGHDSVELLEYIEQIKRLVGSDIPLENEIVQNFYEVTNSCSEVLK